MKTFSLIRCTFVAASLAILAACGANSTAPPPVSARVAPMSAQVRNGIPAIRRQIAHSWMKKLPKGTSGTMWATDLEYGSVDVIAYPSGTLIGQVAGFEYPYGDCSDKQGNVYVADFDSEEGVEIQAGTTKIINSWATGGETIGCSVSNAGDVSFTNFYPGGVKVVAGPGAGASYPGPGYDWPAAYDPYGNLFVMCDDASPCSSPHLAELRAGSSSWIFLNLSSTPSFPTGVQWMDKYLGIGPTELVAISGSNATVVKTITLHGGSCSNPDVGGNWGNISKQPNGVVSKKIKNIAISNACSPNAIGIYNAKNGKFIRSIGPALSYQYDYGVTFTKP